MSSWLEGLIEHLSHEQSDASLVNDFLDFIGEIDWSHWVFKALLLLHVTFAVLACTSAYKGYAPGIITLSCLSFAATRLAEPLNSYFSRYDRWKRLLGLPINYFQDPSGAFISLVWSTPFIVSSFLSVIILLFRLTELMVQAKKLQLRKKKEL